MTMHLLSPTGPVTTCTGAAVETATERGADATANVLVVDCLPCLRQALVVSLNQRDALAAELRALREGVQELKGALDAMGEVIEGGAKSRRPGGS